MQEMYGKTDLEKFVFFIKEFKENLSQYKRVVIRIDFPDNHHNSLDYACKGCEMCDRESVFDRTLFDKILSIES